MNEDFVTFEIAKELKEKGFNEPCINAFNIFKCTYRNGWLEYLDDREDEFITQKDLKNDGDCLLPLIHQVLKWLREEKKIHIEPCILSDGDTDADGKIITHYTYWSFCVTSIETGDMIYFEYEHIDDKRFDSYEQAAIAGIEYVLNNLI